MHSQITFSVDMFVLTLIGLAVFVYVVQSLVTTLALLDSLAERVEVEQEILRGDRAATTAHPISHPTTSGHVPDAPGRVLRTTGAGDAGDTWPGVAQLARRGPCRACRALRSFFSSLGRGRRAP